MGGSKSQDTVIGQTLFLGMHQAVALWPVDGMSQLNFYDREAWRGPPGTRRIEVNAPTLWGGEQREGGPTGHIDLLPGDPDQAVNDYLRQVLAEGEWQPGLAAGVYADPSYNPALVSAFRGVVSLVFRRFGWGNNPYIKPMRQRWHAVNSTYPPLQADPLTPVSSGDWLPEFAPVCVAYETMPMSFYMVLDNSGSMQAGTRDADMREAAKGAIDALASDLADDGGGVSLRIQPFNASIGTAFERIPFLPTDVQPAKDFIDAIPTPPNPGDVGSGTNYEQAATPAEQFFTDAESATLSQITSSSFEPALTTAPSDLRIEDYGLAPRIPRIVAFLSDGFAANAEEAAVLFEAAQAAVYGIGIDSHRDLLIIDNTASDGVPIVASGEAGAADGYLNFLTAPFRSWSDLNATHMMRDVLISPRFGGSGDPSEIGDSFAEKAEACFNKGLGFSFKHRSTASREDTLRKIERHSGLQHYFDEQTGKYEVNLIEDNQDTAGLFTFDAGTILMTGEGRSLDIEFDRPILAEMPNHIVLTYTNRLNGEPIAISDSNPAGVAAAGGLVSIPEEFPGCTCPELAEKLLAREIDSQTKPLGKGEMRVIFCPPSVNRGARCIVNAPNLGLDNAVVRIIEKKEEANGATLLIFNEVGFNTDPATVIAPDDDAPTTGQISRDPLASDDVFFEELAYIDQVLGRGQAEADAALARDVDLGNWQISGNAPNNAHTYATVVRDDAGSWINVGSSSLMPIWSLNNHLSKEADTVIFRAALTGRESQLAAGQVIQIDDERMRLDSVAIDDIGRAVFTVGRAIHDTVPAVHLAGATVMAWQDFALSDAVDYTAADDIDVRFLPRAFGNTLAIDDAATQSLEMASRAARPYPVADLRVEGEYAPAGVLSGVVDYTFSQRNRLLQTSLAFLDHTDGPLAPEVGVTLDLIRSRVDIVGGSRVVTEIDVTAIASPETATGGSTDLSTIPTNADTQFAQLAVRSTRDGYVNWQTPFVEFGFGQAQPAAVDPDFDDVVALWRFSMSPADPVVDAPPNEGAYVFDANYLSGDLNTSYDAEQVLHYPTSWNLTAAGQNLVAGEDVANAAALGIDDSAGPLTIETWVRITEMNEGSNLFFMTHAEIGATVLRLTQEGTNVIRLAVNNIISGGFEESLLILESPENLMSEDVWHHIAAQRVNTRSWEILLDGDVVATGTQTGEAAGEANAVFASVKQGYLDSVRFTRGVSRYVAPFTPAEFLTDGGLTGVFFQNENTFGSSTLATDDDNIEFIGSGTSSTRNAVGGTATPGMPAGVAVGDLLICHIGTTQDDAEDPQPAAFSAAGWEQLLAGDPAVPQEAKIDFISGKRVAVLWRIATGSDTAPTITNPGDFLHTKITAWRGVDTVDPFDDFTISGNTSSVAVRLSEITTTVPNVMVVGLASAPEENGLDTWACASLVTVTQAYEVITNGVGSPPDASSGMGYGIKATAGATGFFEADTPLNHFDNCGIVLGLKPAI